MKAIEFDFQRDLKLDFENGVVSFHNNRLVILDSESLGMLRQSAIQEMGWDKARAMFLRFGYQNGFPDFLQMRANYAFDDEFELLGSGPVIHTWEGVVRAEPLNMAFDRDKGEFVFTGVWKNSYEAEQYLMNNEPADEPVCWATMGYASGWCTAFFGSPLIAIEPVCVGKGDDRCEWLIKPPDAWGEEALPYRAALEQFWR